MSLKQIFNNNLYFIMPLVAFLLIGAFFMFKYPINEGHFMLNQYHTPFFDTFFKYVTDLGDGVLFGVLIVLGLFTRFRLSIYSAVSGIIVLIIISIISKELLFHDWPRPGKVFSNLDIPLHYVEGVRQHIISTFPSGHSTTAFAVFGLLSLFCKRNISKLVFVIIAILAAYSRVYLSQHFVRDIIVGAFIGYLVSFFVYYYFNKKFTNSKLDKSLLNYKK